VQPLVEKILGHVSRRRRTTPATDMQLIGKWKLQETLAYNTSQKLRWDTQETVYVIPSLSYRRRLNYLFEEEAEN
jgi:hypothetical protein